MAAVESSAAAADAVATAAAGYVYCMTNASMPGIVKIGMTLDAPEDRAKELSSSTGVPTPFRVEISKRVANPYDKEQAMHELLSTLGFRINERREFFNCSMKIVEALFALIDGTDVVVNTTEASAVMKKLTVTVVKLDA